MKKEKDPFEKTSNPLYSQYIHLSRYSRYQDDKGRRELWSETVERLISFWEEEFPELKDALRNKVEPAVYNLDVLPSMRSLMTAGPALRRCNVAGYNCTFTVIDSPRCFDEILYILMNGAGVGFSVERQYVQQLPEIPDEFHDSESTVVFRDSKIGWAGGFRELISLLYAGQVPKLDYSKVRPEGSRLVTFGGRASGPEPLKGLCEFTIELFKNARGRKLSSIECHDLVCKIADIVVVGGVRRAALISLSNLSDDRMRTAKSGQWWNDNPQRALANNSYVLTEKPEFQVFLNEWKSLYESKSGERGIFSRVAAQKQAAKNGRRDETKVVGTNPCCFSGDTIIHTTYGPQYIKDLEGVPTWAILNGKAYEIPYGSWVKGKNDLYKLKTSEGYEVEVTEDHEFMTSEGSKKSASSLQPGEKIEVSSGYAPWSGKGTFEEGYLLGMFVGDGNWSRSASENANYFGQVKAYVNDNGYESLVESIRSASASLRESGNFRSDKKDICEYPHRYYSVSNIGQLPQQYGIYPDDKYDIECLEVGTSPEFYRGFLRGFFDADGSVMGLEQNNPSVRVGQVSLKVLKTVQRMLLKLGIFSRISFRKAAGQQLLPDGQGGRKFYRTKPVYELNIGGIDIGPFRDLVGFCHSNKKALLDRYSSENRRPRKFEVTFESLEWSSFGPVYDLEVSDAHLMDANGFVASNSEILLRDKQMCNLSTVIVKPGDTEESLKQKVEVATILGTLQSSLTNFRYLRKKWKQNCEEECLLGVSMTGIMDNHLTNGSFGKNNLSALLNDLREEAVKVNEKWAGKIGINPSAAVTCIKPEGTSSQLTDTASGIHPRFSRYYLRTIRADIKDPLAQFMIDKGFYYEEDKMNSKNYVFYFPVKSPDESTTADELGSINQLELWRAYQDHWCEHKPSMTCYYDDNSFLEVGQWVWDNVDKLSGVSFLPVSEHTYTQAPYQAISREEYEKWLEFMPSDIDWAELSFYEGDDYTEGSQELACSASGGCEI